MQALAVTPDGRSVLVVDDFFDALSMFDATNFDFQGATTLGVAPSNVAVAPHGQFAYVSSTADNTVSVVDLVSQTVIATVPVTAPLGAAFTADGPLCPCRQPGSLGHGHRRGDPPGGRVHSDWHVPDDTGQRLRHADAAGP